MARLLIIHHTPSPAMQALLEAAREGAAQTDAEVVLRPALGATVSDLLAADAVLLGTPANIGYMSGALKHFFDTVYYPVLEATRGLPYGLYVHGNNDTTGARRAVLAIASGLGWHAVRPPVEVIGEPDARALMAVEDLAALAALAAAERSG
jgi:FMN-dependent NADH-azoreductase